MAQSAPVVCSLSPTPSKRFNCLGSRPALIQGRFRARFHGAWLQTQAWAASQGERSWQLRATVRQAGQCPHHQFGRSHCTGTRGAGKSSDGNQGWPRGQ